MTLNFRMPAAIKGFNKLVETIIKRNIMHSMSIDFYICIIVSYTLTIFKQFLLIKRGENFKNKIASRKRLRSWKWFENFNLYVLKCVIFALPLYASLPHIFHCLWCTSYMWNNTRFFFEDNRHDETNLEAVTEWYFLKIPVPKFENIKRTNIMFQRKTLKITCEAVSLIVAI